MTDTTHTFAAYFKRAASPVIILAVLKDKPMYGYEISDAIKQRSGGKYTISVMYPILRGLVEDGCLELSKEIIVDGRARRYYSITPKGEQYLADMKLEFEDLAESFRALTAE